MISKILAIVSSLALAVSLYIIGDTPPASGYELSIYAIYPSYLWILLIISGICGLAILVQQAFSAKQSKLWLVGLLLVILSNLILINLHVFQGWLFPDPVDAKQHLADVYNIINTGYIEQSNFYPIIHIWITNLATITDITPIMAANLITSLFYILYMTSVYLLGMVITKSTSKTLLILAFSSPLIWPSALIAIHPSGLSLFVIPLILYLFHKREWLHTNSFGITICLLILAFFITYLHPITSLFIIIILLLFALIPRFHQLFSRRRDEITGKANIELENTTRLWKSGANVALIMIIIFFVWYFQFASIQGATQGFWEWIINLGDVQSVGARMIESATMADMNIGQIITLITKRYGAVVLYLLLSVFAGLFIIKKSISKDKQIHLISFTYSILLLATMAFSLFNFSVYPIGEASVLRVFRVPIFLSVVLNGIVLFHFIAKGNSQIKREGKPYPIRGYAIGLVSLILIASLIVSVFNFYRSPTIYRSSNQVTHMDLAGPRWIMQYGNPVFTIINSSAYVAPTQQYLLEAEYITLTQFRIQSPIPPHFGYTEYGTIASSLQESYGEYDFYMAISILDRIHPFVYPENVRLNAIHQYTQNDFSKLNLDSTALKIYDCGEFEIWEIYSSGNV